ncbi:hypothetical protein H6F75_12880 [Nodosilinea sp. FACHB-131]|uniref:hypothetical protein n=1 Tax=Cyanophyceae TaxID=3028117 RepID=UPI0016839A35|nr:hypothetical protein [Nodosilinea sp. FACHB-131]MBD1874380.1 hypothetical protein [Nodosilinea sp. FACHB-131]
MINLLMPLAAVTMCSAPVAVELDVFSGRPNPVWNLSEAQCAEVEQHIDQLPEVADESLQSLPALGYRGLIIHYENQQGVRDFIRIYRGVSQSEEIQLQDPDRKLEKWLISTGQDLVDSNMQEYLQTELAQ